MRIGEQAWFGSHGEANNDRLRREIGESVFIDVWLLALGHHLIHWDSAVAKLATFLNPELKSHYIPGD